MTPEEYLSEIVELTQTRMPTLRDWFAGQALAGLLARPPWDVERPARTPASVAAEAYDYAAAMLAEKEKRDDPHG